MFGFENFEGKCKREKIDGKSRRKEKKIKINKLFLFATSNLFNLF